MHSKFDQVSNALVVEDEFLIAIDAAEAIREMGVPVVSRAGSYREARDHIEREPPELAVVDLDLGRGGRGEELIPVLSANGCGCLVLSGDDLAIEEMRARFPQWPVLRKPAPKRQIQALLRTLIAGSETETMASGSVKS